MKSFDEYVHFVLGAKIAGCEIEFADARCSNWQKTTSTHWNLEQYDYRIKLPAGYEYVIEDGDIAFREPKFNEWYLNNGCYTPFQCELRDLKGKKYKRPIIKRKQTEEE
jgi:hypothetical protein